MYNLTYPQNQDCQDTNDAFQKYICGLLLLGTNGDHEILIILNRGDRKILYSLDWGDHAMYN